MTISPTPTTTRPGIFDFAGRAKWDAWSSVGKAYVNQPTEAEQRYLDIAKELGWKEGAGEVAKAENTQKSQSEAKGDDEDIWDDSDEEIPSSKKSGGGGGLGTAVSTMAEASRTDVEESLHGLARTGEVKGFKSFLSSHPHTDVNARDENVSTPKAIMTVILIQLA